MNLDGVLSQMQVMYQAPYGLTDEQKQQVVETYRAVLQRFPDSVLTAAWQDVLASHEKATWPKPAEIAANCRDLGYLAPEPELPDRIRESEITADKLFEQACIAGFGEEWMRISKERNALQGRMEWEYRYKVHNEVIDECKRLSQLEARNSIEEACLNLGRATIKRNRDFARMHGHEPQKLAA